MRTALTIAGSDSSGGAGIQADIKTMLANGVYAMSAITALTAQNTTGVTAIMDVTPDFLKEQMENVFTDIRPDAVKIGMVSASPLIETIAEELKKFDAANIVVDPVMVATSGAKLISDEAVATLKEKCKKSPTVQIYVADGLSGASVAANIPDLLPAILQGLQSYKIDTGTPFFVKYGRVGVMDEISELLDADVTCTLIGERPGLITAESMSAYIAYKATVGMPEARRTVVSNIHKNGTIPSEAGAHIAEIIKIMLEKKASGTDLKL